MSNAISVAGAKTGRFFCFYGATTSGHTKQNQTIRFFFFNSIFICFRLEFPHTPTINSTCVYTPPPKKKKKKINIFVFLFDWIFFFVLFFIGGNLEQDGRMEVPISHGPPVVGQLGSSAAANLYGVPVGPRSTTSASTSSSSSQSPPIIPIISSGSTSGGKMAGSTSGRKYQCKMCPQVGVSFLISSLSPMRGSFLFNLFYFLFFFLLIASSFRIHLLFSFLFFFFYFLPFPGHLVFLTNLFFLFVHIPLIRWRIYWTIIDVRSGSQREDSFSILKVVEVSDATHAIQKSRSRSPLRNSKKNSFFYELLHFEWTKIWVIHIPPRRIYRFFLIKYLLMEMMRVSVTLSSKSK